MHKPRYCVYNTTRECFLSLGVAAADTTFSRLKGLIGKLVLRADEGLWVVPSSGIHSIGVFFQLDLIYLDESNQVIHLVESLPSFQIAPLRTQAASVLQLPTHSIFSSQTQLGDRLVICVAEEMEQQLKTNESSNQKLVTQKSAARKEAEMTTQKNSLLASWFKRLFSRERRGSDRLRSSNLAAHFWTGAAPTRHEVQDISPTGLYLKTEERFYPGTVVTMTLQRTDEIQEGDERSITVKSKSVRTGTDGVGMAFILPEGKASNGNSVAEGVDKKTLLQFLKSFRKGND